MSEKRPDQMDPHDLAKDIMTYKPWNEEQTKRGKPVAEAIEAALVIILCNVPPSADRSTAIRKLREARMDCNSAITHGGKY